MTKQRVVSKSMVLEWLRALQRPVCPQLVPEDGARDALLP